MSSGSADSPNETRIPADVFRLSIWGLMKSVAIAALGSTWLSLLASVTDYRTPAFVVLACISTPLVLCYPILAVMRTGPGKHWTMYGLLFLSFSTLASWFLIAGFVRGSGPAYLARAAGAIVLSLGLVHIFLTSIRPTRCPSCGRRGLLAEYTIFHGHYARCLHCRARFLKDAAGAWYPDPRGRSLVREPCPTAQDGGSTA